MKDIIFYPMLVMAVVVGVILTSWALSYQVAVRLSYSYEATNDTMVRCCEGHPCTDTYYNPKDDSCHLSLCEGMPFANQCTYPLED